jgi:predicted HTH transcriptional regulator
MFDTLEALQEKIKMGEDGRLELKSVHFRQGKISGPHADGLADELAGFANSSGGVIVLGIDDETLEPQGLAQDQLNALENWVQSICNDRVKPPLMCRIEKWKLTRSDGRRAPIVKIDIPKSLFVHESPNGHFYRIGSSKRKMTTEYIIRLGQQRSQARLIRFDEQAVTNAAPEDFEQNLYQRFRTPLTEESDHAFLSKLRLITQDDQGIWRPTVAGILMATSNPRQWIPNAFIQAVCYRGTDRDASDQVDHKDIEGPIDEQILAACRFVKLNMKVAAYKSPGRVEVPQYAMAPVFEAVVNAVAHRDYSIYGSKIRLHMFADRLELFSPGSLLNTLTIDSLHLRQVSRNELITSLLARSPIGMEGLSETRQYMMDKRGEGVPIILQKSEALSGKKPVYRLIDEAELLLTIYAADPHRMEKI